MRGAPHVPDSALGPAPRCSLVPHVASLAARERADAPVADCEPTCTTLHLWMQIVGKTRLALVPWINHSWHATLYLTARGLTTSTIAHGSGAFEVDFDFGADTLRVAASGVVTLALAGV